MSGRFTRKKSKSNSPSKTPSKSITKDKIIEDIIVKARAINTKYTRRRKPLKGGGKTRKQVNDSLMEKYSPTTAKKIVEEWTKSKRSINKRYPNESSSEKKILIKEKFAESMRNSGYNVTLRNKSKSPKSKSPKSKKKSPKTKTKSKFLKMFKL